jgi:hypothetical protein
MSKVGKSQPTGNYPIGYCRPPAANQFKPGSSGNNKRPFGEPHNETSIVERVLREKRSAIVRGKKRLMCNEDLMIRQQNDKAVGGDLKATIFLMDRRAKLLALRGSQPEGHYDLTVITDEELRILENILSKAWVDGDGKPQLKPCY